MRSTSWRLLVALLAVAAVVGWVVVRLVESFAGRYLPVSWTAAGAVWLLAIALLMWIIVVRPRLLRRKGTEPLDPHVAARTSALALASSRTGAVVLGLYLGIAVGFLGEWATQLGRESAIAAGVTALGAAAVAGLGLWLEYLCRVDDDPEGEIEGVELPGANQGPLESRNGLNE